MGGARGPAKVLQGRRPGRGFGATRFWFLVHFQGIGLVIELVARAPFGATLAAQFGNILVVVVKVLLVA